MLTQELFDFSETLTDADGDTVVVSLLSDTVFEITLFLKCSKKKALEVLETLQKDFDVYSNPEQIILAKGNKIIHNFELHGETYFHGHKYNPVNEWDFKQFLQGKKTRNEKRKSAERPPKPLKITCT